METHEFIAIDLLGFHGTTVPCSASPVSRISVIIAFLVRPAHLGEVWQWHGQECFSTCSKLTWWVHSSTWECFDHVNVPLCIQDWFRGTEVRMCSVSGHPSAILMRHLRAFLDNNKEKILSLPVITSPRNGRHTWYIARKQEKSMERKVSHICAFYYMYYLGTWMYFLLSVAGAVAKM